MAMEAQHYPVGEERSEQPLKLFVGQVGCVATTLWQERQTGNSRGEDA